MLFGGFLTIVLVSAVIALIAGFVLRRKGYTFARSFITWFLAAAGILALLFKVFGDYLSLSMRL